MASPDLTEWVAVKPNIFARNPEKEKVKFICGWNKNENKIAVIFHEGCRQASDNSERNKASLLNVSDLQNIHKQLSLIDPTIDKHYPIKQPKLNNTFLPNLFNNRSILEEDMLLKIEHYLYKAAEIFGKKIVLSLIFNECDTFDDFEESINELKLKSLENSVNDKTKELEEILALRKRAETLLEMRHIYALEDEVAKALSVAYSELYNFHLMPFLELRELAHSKLTKAKQRLREEIGPNIKKKVLSEFDEWNEQYFTAAEALQHLYQDYYRKTYELVHGQHDRMSEDQNRFGKAAFTLYGLPRLQKLQESIYVEKQKLLQSIKASLEYQRDRIKQQLTCIQSNSNAFQEMDRIEQEIYGAQNNVLDAHLDVLENEEKLYKTQLANMMREYSDDLGIGVFYEAVERPEEFDSICDSPKQDIKINRVKEKLNKVNRKRALVRNKKKSLAHERKEKQQQRELSREKEKKNSAIKRPDRKLTIRELPVDKMKEERKKTIQRLKEYKKKASMLASTIEDHTVFETENKEEDDARDSQTCLTIKPKLKPSSDEATEKARRSSLHDMQQLETNTLAKKDPLKQKVRSSSTATEPSVLPPLPPPPLPTSILVPPPVPTNIPVPPPLPTFIPIPPPPPPPPPPPNFSMMPPAPPLPNKSAAIPIPPSTLNLTADLLKAQLAKAKKPDLKDVKVLAAAQPFNLEEILSMRSKLKKPSEDKSKLNGEKFNTHPNDFNALLHSTLKRIRNMTEGSDLESDAESDSDFD